MIAEVATRVLTKRLRKAGWKPVRADGSHSWWECPTGAHGVRAGRAQHHLTRGAPLGEQGNDRVRLQVVPQSARAQERSTEVATK